MKKRQPITRGDKRYRRETGQDQGNKAAPNKNFDESTWSHSLNSDNT